MTTSVASIDGMTTRKSAGLSLSAEPSAHYPDRDRLSACLSPQGCLMGRFVPDSALERTGFEPVWGFSCQVVFWLVGGSLFGARKSFFVPSPAIRFAERAEGVKGPKR